jgi:hypothetical protein
MLKQVTTPSLSLNTPIAIVIPILGGEIQPEAGQCEQTYCHQFLHSLRSFRKTRRRCDVTPLLYALKRVSSAAAALPTRPLSPLLSQALVAFTVGFDNELQRRTAAQLSLFASSNVMRFLLEGCISAGELAANWRRALLQRTPV